MTLAEAREVWAEEKKIRLEYYAAGLRGSVEVVAA
jgi:hypothetical protein